MITCLGWTAQWVALVDDENEADEGIQGYLKLSVSVLGPNDKLKAHSDSEGLTSGRCLAVIVSTALHGYSSRIAAPTCRFAGIDSLSKKGASAADALQLLIPPTVKQDLRFLVITIYKAQLCSVSLFDVG